MAESTEKKAATPATTQATPAAAPSPSPVVAASPAPIPPTTKAQLIERAKRLEASGLRLAPCWRTSKLENPLDKAGEPVELTSEDLASLSLELDAREAELATPGKS